MDERSDPNFPKQLNIAPAAPKSQDAGDAWCHDSAEDIADYGIAGRIWYVHTASRHLCAI